MSSGPASSDSSSEKPKPPKRPYSPEPPVPLDPWWYEYSTSEEEKTNKAKREREERMKQQAEAAPSTDYEGESLDRNPSAPQAPSPVFVMREHERFPYAITVPHIPAEFCTDFPDSRWLVQFISSRGNEYFCEVDEEYLTDRFNLTGLNTEVAYYQYALDLVTDVFDLDADDDLREQIEKSARHLYGLVHARYIITTRGLSKMVRKRQ